VTTRVKRTANGWQAARLRAFARKEREEARFYEAVYERMAKKIPYRVLAAMAFILSEEYARKPGSLVTLYRAAHESETPCADFEKRFERYYVALQERGYV